MTQNADAIRANEQRVNHAPRRLGRVRPSEIIEVDARGRPTKEVKEVDGCAYVKVHASNFERLVRAADFVGVVDIDYDYARHGHLLRSDGTAESSHELTPLAIGAYDEVLLNRTPQLPDRLLLEGICTQEGLCTVRGCEEYVNAGPSLVVARRYCGQETGDKVVMLALAIFPVEGDDLYDQDGSTRSLSELLAQIQFDEKGSVTSRCDS